MANLGKDKKAALERVASVLEYAARSLRDHITSPDKPIDPTHLTTNIRVELYEEGGGDTIVPIFHPGGSIQEQFDEAFDAWLKRMRPPYPARLMDERTVEIDSWIPSDLDSVASDLARTITSRTGRKVEVTIGLKIQPGSDAIDSLDSDLVGYACVEDTTALDRINYALDEHGRPGLLRRT